MKELVGKVWENGYSFKPFEIKTTSREFRFCRRQAMSEGEKLVPSNISASWTPYHFETLIGGVLQGRKQGDIRGASLVCKSRMWKVALETSGLVNASQVEDCLTKAKYMDVRTDDLLAARQAAKQIVRNGALDGWIRNAGDGEFCLENYGA